MTNRLLLLLYILRNRSRFEKRETGFLEISGFSRKSLKRNPVS
ncbi:MAG: hypothetical protein ACRCT1_20925 [Microcoleaceae cyanobacterium]